MKLVLDEDIPCSFREVFEKIGFQVIDIHDTSLRGRSDAEIFDFAQGEKAVLVTADKDFLNFVFILRRKHHGLIIVRFPSFLSIELREKELGRLLRKLPHKDLKGSVITIQPGRMRIRKKY